MFIMKLLLNPEGEGAVILEMSKSTQSPPPTLKRFFGWGGLWGLTIVYVCIHMHVCNVGAVLQLVL